MKKIIPFLAGCCCLFLTACNTTTPEKYFDVAVLNCNLMMGFANEGLLSQLEQPSVKMAEGSKDQTVPMKRKEVIDNKIQFLEDNFGRLKQLKETDDSKDILQASRALYEYVIPVYKNEYQQLAKLYDEGAAKDVIQSFAQSIQDKYFSGFEDRYNKLTNAGKPYAERHHIKVEWRN